MICPRHRAIATHAEHDRAYCLRCFGETKAFAAERGVEDIIRRLQGRPTTVITVRGLGKRRG